MRIRVKPPKTDKIPKIVHLHAVRGSDSFVLEIGSSGGEGGVGDCGVGGKLKGDMA